MLRHMGTGKTTGTSTFRHIRLPLFVLLVILMLGQTITWVILRNNQQRIQIATEVTAEQVILRLQDWIDTRVYSLLRLERAAPPLHGDDPSLYKQVATSLIDTYPGFQAINWIDSTLTISQINPVEGNEPALNKQLRYHPDLSVRTASTEAIRTGEIKRTDRILLLQGGYGFATYYPVFSPDGELLGLINGVFRIDDLVRTCLNEGNLLEKYRFAFVDRQDVVISNHNFPSLETLPEAAVERPIRFVDAPWRFVMAPSRESIHDSQHGPIFWIHLISVVVALLAAWVAEVLQKRRWALREQREMFQSLFTSSHDAVYITSRSGRFLATNQAMVELLGYETAELERLNAVDLYQHPDDRARLLESLHDKGFVRDYDVQLRRKDGQILFCRLTSNETYDHNNELTGYQGIIRDITDQIRATEALRASEENLATILDSIGDGVIATDTRGLIVRMNPIACRLTGWTFEEAAGRKLTDVLKLYRQSDPNHLLNPVEQVLEKGQIIGLATDTMLIDREGRRHNLADSSAPIRGRDGKLNGVVLVFRDITAEHQLQEQLRQAQKMEAIGRLAGGVAHDFNNLLTAITGNADLALMRLEREEPPHTELKEVQRTAGRAADLTRQLLAFSRRQVISSRLVDVNSILTDMGQMLSRLIGEHIELNMQLDDNTPKVMADPAQLEQVVMNLVVNAADAMPDGGTLSISTERITLQAETLERLTGLSAGHYTLLRVTDTGTGMPPDVQDRIFEPFYTTKVGEKGTGLGLATVYGIVKQTNGDIQVRSHPGEGTSFAIYLPEGTAEMNAEPDIPDEAGSLEGQESLLVVEDEVAVSDLAVRTLSQFGYTVEMAPNGAEALELCQARNYPYDLIITDVVMPKMGGVEFARVLETLWPGIRVLFISGYHEEMNIDRTHPGKQYSYMQKPFKPVELVQRVRAMLDASPPGRE
ncbi:PAS domain S-box protein [bacterium]|nr:PAS domain S-box protein [bacterium]